MKKILIEAVLVLGVGVGLALAANALSPRGLSLTRDHFPEAKRSETKTTEIPAASTGLAPVAPRAKSAVERLKERGLQAVGRNEVERWYNDPRYAEGAFVFVDARDEERFRTGHIPGAYVFNRYRPDDHLAVVLPVCAMAEKVVVYCSGGDCEDSEFTALMLRDLGVPAENIFVYSGGVADWKAGKLPLETGDQYSGVLLQP